MSKRVERPGVREGYDRWSDSYDETPNPLVSLDRRHTVRALDPRPGERVLDAGCGTGAHLGRLCAARSLPVGLDFSDLLPVLLVRFHQRRDCFFLLIELGAKLRDLLALGVGRVRQPGLDRVLLRLEILEGPVFLGELSGA